MNSLYHTDLLDHTLIGVHFAFQGTRQEDGV